jgi:hypothetical protein
MSGMTIAGLAGAGDVSVETVRYDQRRGLAPEAPQLLWWQGVVPDHRRIDRSIRRRPKLSRVRNVSQAIVPRCSRGGTGSAAQPGKTSGPRSSAVLCRHSPPFSALASGDDLAPAGCLARRRCESQGNVPDHPAVPARPVPLERRAHGGMTTAVIIDLTCIMAGRHRPGRYIRPVVIGAQREDGITGANDEGHADRRQGPWCP